MMNWEKPLPSHTHLDYWECFAKILLEKIFPCFYNGLEVKDKPDLQSPDGSLGIEVTQAIDSEQQEAESMYIKRHNIKECVLKGKAGSDSFDLIMEALNRKLVTLNKGGYAKFDQYDLLVRSDIISDDEMRQKALNEMITASKNYQVKFRRIVVMVPEWCYLFDLENAECWDIHVPHEIQGQIGGLARLMVHEGEKTLKDT